MTTETLEAPEVAVAKKSRKKDSDKKVKGKSVSYHFKGVKIGSKKTHCYFEREIVNELKEGEEDNTVYITQYPIKSDTPPHQDLLKALKALTGHALAIGEFEIEGSKAQYTVIEVKIWGDMEMQQSRCELILGKKVKRTDKVIPIKTGQVSMYGESDYPEFAKMAVLVETVKEEAWAYAFDGKFGTEDPNQLPLFIK